MAREPMCSDCGVAMEAGFVPDLARGGYAQAHWHEGEPRPSKFLLSSGLQVEGSWMVPIEAFRCPKCALLRLYAPRESKA